MAHVGETIVKQHYDEHKSIGLKVRHTSPIIEVRNFNNWLKAVLIANSTHALERDMGSKPLTALDLACGKGGDLPKWTRHNVGHVVFADIAEVSVNECRSRYEDQRRKNRRAILRAAFIVADCAKESLSEKVLKAASGDLPKTFRFNITSCQFSFHYSFETAERANQMFRNAVENLFPGGYFIGTIPDSNRIMKRLRNSDSNEFGNKAYKIRFPDDFDRNSTPALFGCKYHFYLDGAVNCPEFLVHWPLFQYLAQRHGLKLITKMGFDAFLKFHFKDEMNRNLLDRMRGLISLNQPPTGEKAENMEHVTEYLKSNNGDVWPIGTISKDQWEITTVYMAFVFQKI